ncbi:hypothetical protein EDB19DRAFT_151982 [Suillus lakei]|nr:hypothetical protein EDB19DRAFT_151982 [Suillus lakei]
MLEWADSAQVLGDTGDVLRVARTVLARTSATVMLISNWWTSPACRAISKSQSSEASTMQEVTVLGFASALGSPYLMFWLISFSIVWLMTQLSGQVVHRFTLLSRYHQQRPRRLWLKRHLHILHTRSRKHEPQLRPLILRNRTPSAVSDAHVLQHQPPVDVSVCPVGKRVCARKDASLAFFAYFCGS